MTSLESGSSTGDPGDPFPGWYPDPLGAATHRFWNGREWTSNTKGPAPVPAATPEADPADRVAASRPRIFGSAPADEPIKAEPATELTKAEPAKAEPAKAEPAKAEPTTELTKAESVKGATVTEASRRSGGLTFDDDASSTVQPSANRPGTLAQARTSDKVARGASAEQDSSRPRWLLLVGAAVVAAIGFGAGWLINDRSQDDQPSQAASSAATSTTTATQDAGGDESQTDPDAELVATAESAIEARDEAEAARELAEGQVEEATVAIGELTVERDDALAHNAILQTWFTQDVRARSERNWEAEVARGCAAEDGPTIENTTYTRSMELIGTHNGLVVAIEACRAEG